MSLDQLELTRLDGSAFPKSELADRAVLFVNVASRCGLTPQYTGLVELHGKYDGLTVVGVPCNQFGAQEPGSPDEIATFCSVTYGVDFPLLEKQDVNGDTRSPLYRWLVDSEPGQGKDIAWNFGKFLVGRDGEVRARFEPTSGTPDDAVDWSRPSSRRSALTTSGAGTPPRCEHGLVEGRRTCPRSTRTQASQGGPDSRSAWVRTRTIGRVGHVHVNCQNDGASDQFHRITAPLV